MDPSQRMRRQKLRLKIPADLFTVVGGAIPSLLNRPKFFSLHNMVFVTPEQCRLWLIPTCMGNIGRDLARIA